MSPAVAASAIRLVLFDLDGTLLDPERAIHPANIRAIAALMARGLRVGVATGRMPRSALPYVERISATGPLVLGNGSLVWDVDQARAVYRDALPREDALAAFALARQHGVHVNVYVDDELWIPALTETALRSAQKDGLEPLVIADIPARARIMDVAITKLMIVDEETPVMRLAEPIRRLMEHPCTLVNSEPEYLEVLAPGVTKGSALPHIERVYGIAPGQVLALGDRHNDLELLRAAGVGVAMGNAHDDVKAIADHVIGDNRGDAIAVFLTDFFALA